MSAFAVLVCGGSGTRMGVRGNKTLLPIAGVPACIRAYRTLSTVLDGAVVVVRVGEEDIFRDTFAAFDESPYKIVAGGADRQASVYAGLCSLPESCTEVLVHDGARPLVTESTVQAVLTSVRQFGTGVAAMPVRDTIKRADEDGHVLETLNRAELYAMQTPQGFRKKLLLKAHEKIKARMTDDAALVEALGVDVRLVMSEPSNMKLTSREDIVMAQALAAGLSVDAEAIDIGACDMNFMGRPNANIRPTMGDTIRTDSMRPAAMQNANGQAAMSEHSKMEQTSAGSAMLRIGQGIDAHRLVEGRKLILCGAEIPYERGLLGHSDADVALHALMDALLGAAALGDIGRHFPDTDERYNGISSLLLLQKVREILSQHGFSPVNCDIAIIAQAPKLASYIFQMRHNIAEALRMPEDTVSVKATTTERMGYEGRGEGISAQAVAMIRKDEKQKV